MLVSQAFHNIMSASHLTQDHHVYTICPNVIFQILLPCSRPMMLYVSSSSIKEKEIQNKRNIKSRKIDKRKRKMLVSKAFHNTVQTSNFSVIPSKYCFYFVKTSTIVSNSLL